MSSSGAGSRLPMIKTLDELAAFDAVVSQVRRALAGQDNYLAYVRPVGPRASGTIMVRAYAGNGAALDPSGSPLRPGWLSGRSRRLEVEVSAELVEAMGTSCLRRIKTADDKQPALTYSLVERMLASRIA